MLKLFEYLRLDDRLNELFDRIRAELVSHDREAVWKHTLRVINSCFVISKFVECDFNKVLVSAIIHDVGYIQVINGHEKVSALLMKGLLDSMFDSSFVGEIIHNVEAHECDGPIRPQTIEAKILHDADMMDYCGEKGIINAFLLGSDLGLSDSAISKRIIKAIEEGFLIKAVKLKFDKELSRTEDFFTNLVKDFSKERAEFLENGLVRE